MQNTDTTKYIIRSKINADGIIEKPDIVGAIFGQTEGLLGFDMDLRDLQKTGRIGRIEVVINAKGGKTKGSISVPSSLDRVETAILAASLETIDRVGPCTANVEVSQIEDVRATKRQHIIDRAKYILTDMFDENLPESQELADEVRQSIRIEEMEYHGKNKIPCGPNAPNSDAIIVVEGRADVLNLLRYGIKNTICVGGTNVPPEVAELTKNKTVTAFTDGDRGGELIIKELLQVADIDYIARAPDGKSVEDLVQREILQSLRQKIPVEQALDNYSIKSSGKSGREEKPVKGGPVKGGRIAHLSKRKVRAKNGLPEQINAKQLNNQSVKEEKSEEKDSNSVKLSPNARRFKSHSDTLDGTLGARLLNSNDGVIEEIAVRDLVNTLKNATEDIKSVVFDGVITQRILDIASEKGIENVIGVKTGNIAKSPANVNILTTTDF